MYKYIFTPLYTADLANININTLYKETYTQIINPMKIIISISEDYKTIRFKNMYNNDKYIIGYYTNNYNESYLNSHKTISSMFNLDTFAGGHFVIYNDNLAQLTIYGSGIPIIDSFLGNFDKI